MRSAQQAAEKFVNRSAQAAPDYVEGAQSTTKDQAALAAAAEKNYEQGVQEAIGRKAFATGVRKAGKAKWLAGVVEKGANRFAEGVRTAQSAYAEESGKYDNARRAADSLPRGLKGSAQNINRAVAVINAQRAAKVGKSA